MTGLSGDSHRRRWFQYGTGSLLVVMLVVGVMLGWLNAARQKYRRQAETLEQIQALKGRYAARAEASPWLRRLVGDDCVDVQAVSFAGIHRHTNQTSSRGITNEQLAVVRGLSGLRSLSLHGCPEITDEGLRHLRPLAKLRRLSLHRTGVTDAGLSHLPPLTNLQVLSLQHTQVTQTGYPQLQVLRELRDLDLSHTASTGPIRLSGFPQLRKLHFGGARAAGSGDRIELHLSDFPKLSELDVDGLLPWRVRLARLPVLKEISAALWRGTPAEVQLADLPRLARIELQGRRCKLLRLRNTPGVTSLSVTMQAIAADALQGFNGLPNLTVVRFRGPCFTDLPLDWWPNLQQADLADTRLGDRAIQRLSKLRRLRDLNLTRTRITDAALAHLADLESLRNLQLAQTRVTDRGLASMAGLTELRSLGLAHTRISGKGLARFWDLSKLTALDLSGTKIGDEDLKQLVPLTNLEELKLDHTNVTDAGLERLTALTALRQVSLYSTKVTEQAVFALDKAHPNKLRAVTARGNSYANGWVDAQ